MHQYSGDFTLLYWIIAIVVVDWAYFGGLAYSWGDDFAPIDVKIGGDFAPI